MASLKATGGIDGAYLKSRSPSRGPGDVKVYEGRARSFALREHFLIAPFCRAEYRRALEGDGVRKALDSSPFSICTPHGSFSSWLIARHG